MTAAKSDAAELKPSHKYKNWKDGDAWPADVPRRVRNTLQANTHPPSDGNGMISYYDQRIRAGQVFTLVRPQDFAPHRMRDANAPIESEPEPTVAQPRTMRGVASGRDWAGRDHRPLSSADINSSYRRDQTWPEDDEAPTPPHNGLPSRVAQNEAQPARAVTEYDPYAGREDGSR